MAGILHLMDSKKRKSELARLRKQAKNGGNSIKAKIARGELPTDYYKTLGKRGGNAKWHNNPNGAKLKKKK